MIVRNEENFAEKVTYTFNYARLILIAFVAFLIATALAVFLVTGVLSQHLDPRYSEQEAKRQLIEMQMTMDSLKYEVSGYDLYIRNVRRILSGELNAEEIDSISSPEIRPDIILSEQVEPIDSQFRAQFEKGAPSELSYDIASAVSEFRSLYLFNPMDGMVSDQYNPKEGHFGTDIVGKENEPVKAVADGIVIVSSWTLDGGHILAIQHRAGLVSVYKHNSELLKNVGNFVSGGDIIAIVGNSGELTTGPHLHFELWHNGSPVNPEEYIGF